MFTPTLRCECAQPASDRLMRKWCIISSKIVMIKIAQTCHSAKVCFFYRYPPFFEMKEFFEIQQCSDCLESIDKK